MRTPGFTAEAASYRTKLAYRSVGTSFPSAGLVQQAPTGASGQVFMALRYPSIESILRPLCFFHTDSHPGQRPTNTVCVCDGDCSSGRCVKHVVRPDIAPSGLGFQRAPQYYGVCAPCLADSQCRSGFCDSGTCKPCTSPNDCASGFCDNGTCKPCSSPNDCTSRFCDNGTCRHCGPNDCPAGEVCGVDYNCHPECACSVKPRDQNDPCFDCQSFFDGVDICCGSRGDKCYKHSDCCSDYICSPDGTCQEGDLHCGDRHCSDGCYEGCTCNRQDPNDPWCFRAVCRD